MSFVIIASPRTGSTHLTALLHKHSEIICHGEIFHPKMTNPLRRWETGAGVSESAAEMLELRRRDPRQFVRRVFENNDGGKHVGFKIFNGHNDEVLDELIVDSAVKKIVLFRANLLAVYSSSRIAHKIGERVLKTPRESQPLVRFEQEKFVKYCRKYTAFYRDVVERLAASRQNFHLLDYAAINDPSLFAALVSFIGADPGQARLEPSMIKQNSPDLLKRFSNPDEVGRFLRENGLMNWLYEGETTFVPFRNRRSKTSKAATLAAGQETAGAS
ncbi:MAG TPA: hypothetical protein VKR31_01250 [Rhizomicrobium sp.]|nr:hypothetical protein [Rhizomicrobium sp.]